MPRVISLIAVLVLLSVPAAGQFQTESFAGQDVVAGEILVKFRGASGPQAMAFAAQDADIASSEIVGSSGVLKLKSRNRNVGALLQAYRSRVDILYAEPNYVWHAADFPNDELFSRQWALKNTEKTGADIGAVQAWDITEGSRSIVIGVVDSGIDYDHPDLAANIWTAPAAFSVTVAGSVINCAAGTHGFNAITRTCDPRDDDGHGTHVAGILGASGNNGNGVAGVSRVASIMGLKFLGPQGGTTSDALAALDFAGQVKSIFASAANIRVLNNSWGGFTFSQALLDEINQLNAMDVLFVAAAGNKSGGTNNDLTPEYPANFTASNVVSVAATDHLDTLASFSNWGPTSVDLGAPGDGILSTLPFGLFGSATGTSMSAPMVAGAAALVLSACPLSTTALKDNLLNGTDALPSLAGKTVSGGRLNVLRSLLACRGTAPASFGLTISPGRVQMDTNQSTAVAVTVSGANGFAGAVQLAVQALPPGITATLSDASISGGSGSVTLTLSVAATVEAGTYVVSVLGTDGGNQRIAAVSVAVGFTIRPGQAISGHLSSMDAPSLAGAGKYADLYRLTIGATETLNIHLKSQYFDTALYVRSSSGQVLFFDDDGGSVNDSRIQEILPAGTYSIEVTSKADGATGRYTLSINAPTLTSLTPYLGIPGSTVNITLFGDRLTTPLAISAGSGITVSNLSVTSAALATATLTLDPTAARTARDLTVQTPDGTSNPLPFIIPPLINPGQRILDALSSSDQASANATPGTYVYADFYQLTLTADASVTIDMTSAAFTPLVRVLNSNGSVFSTGTSAGSGDLWRITASLSAGTYFLEATSSSAGAAGSYSLAINLPFLSSLSPGFLAPGTATTVQISGNRLASPMTVAAGSDITILTANAASSTAGSARFDVSGSAATGRRAVTLTTPAGTSNNGFINIVPITTLTSGLVQPAVLSPSDPPSSGSAGRYADMYRVSPPLSSPSNLNLFTLVARSTSSKTALILFNASGSVLATAASDETGRAGISGYVFTTGQLFAEVSSDDQPSYSIAFNASAVTAITPNFGSQSSVVNIVLHGDFLRSSPSTIDAGPGITVSNVGFANPTQITARLAISPAAAIGRREIRFTSVDGTDVLPFTVFPAIPTIDIGQTISGTLASPDPESTRGTGTYADLYSLNLQAKASIELRSTAFIPSLTVLDSQGTVVASNEGPAAARILNLGAGAYTIEVSSAAPALGNYTLTVPRPPNLTSITPNRGGYGSTFGVILRGTNFSPSMTVAFEQLAGVSDMRVYSPTLATAILTLGAPRSFLNGTPLTLTVPAFLDGDTGSGSSASFTVAPGVTPTTPATVLDFPRFFSPSELGSTGIAVVNPGSAPAEVLFSRYDETGLLKGYYLETLAPGAQTSRLGSELFPQAAGAGWIKVTSTTAGLLGFWVGGDFSSVMDGAENARFAPEILFPLITAATEINVVRSGVVSAPVTFQLLDAGGNVLASSNASLVSNGGFKNKVSNIFPGTDLSAARSLRVNGVGTDVAGTSVVPDLSVTPSWIVLNGVATSTTSTQLNFAHVPVGGGWSAVAGVTNLSTSTQTVTLTYTPAGGSPVSVTRSLAGGASLRDFVDNLFSFTTSQDGWVKVSGTLPLTGFIAYGYNETGGAAAVPVQSVPQASMMFSHVATGPSWGTGLALLNASTTDANVEVYVMRKTGALVGGAANVPTATFTLPAGTKRAALLTEFVPSSTADDGFVFVRSSNGVPLYGFELFFSRDLKIISNVPFGGLANGITFVPPAP